MSRFRALELSPSLEFCLMLGPSTPWDDGLTDEDLEAAWRMHGAGIMEKWELRDAQRPWGWWVYECGEDPPAFEPGAKEVRLAELGELTDSETEEIAAKAAKAQEIIDSGRPRGYVATGGGKRIDFEQEAIDLWERVQEARKLR